MNNDIVKNSKNPQVKVIAEELDRVSAISAISNMEGGKILVKGLLSEVVDDIDQLTAKYSTLTLQEFMALCADMKTKLDFVRTLKRSDKNKQQAEEDLREALLE